MYCWKNTINIFCWISLVIFLVSCDNKNNNEAYEKLDFKTKTRLKQYVHEGLRLYQKHCQNCHQESGEGLAALYPPLKNSDFFKEDVPRAVCIMKNGQEGEINVNGISFNQPMPENIRLTNLEIAEITTYLLYAMNDSVAIVTMHDVADYLERCEKDSIK